MHQIKIWASCLTMAQRGNLSLDFNAEDAEDAEKDIVLFRFSACSLYSDKQSGADVET